MRRFTEMGSGSASRGRFLADENGRFVKAGTAATAGVLMGSAWLGGVAESEGGKVKGEESRMSGS